MVADTIEINSAIINNYPVQSFQGIGDFFNAAKSVIHYRYNRHAEHGVLESLSREPKSSPNKTPRWTRKRIEKIHKENPRWKSPRISRELEKQTDEYVSAKTCRKVMKAYDLKNGLVIKKKPRKKRKTRKYKKLSVVEVDVKGWFRIKGIGKIYPIAVKDNGTKVAVIGLYTSMASKKIIHCLKRFIKLYGKPRTVKTDNHQIFKSEEFNNWLKKQGIKHKYIPKAKPWFNGNIESFFATVEKEFLCFEFFTTLQAGNRRLSVWLKDYLNNRHHSTIKCTPVEKFASS